MMTLGTHSLKLLFILFTLWITLGSGADTTLRHVNVVYRHGDRSAVVTFPTDPNPVNTTWPDGLGMLTQAGMRMQYSLGRFLRRKYDGFLSGRYYHTEINVQSSDRNRCLESAYCCLAGLYPPHGDQVWDRFISWQPIPVHTRPTYEDNMLAIRKHCPRYDELYAASLKTVQIQKEEAENKAFYDFLEEKTGYQFPSTPLKDIWRIIDTLYCEKQHNKTKPSWVNSTVYEKLEELWALNYDLLFHGKEESRLKGGPLLKAMIHGAQDQIDNKPYAVKLNMYSVHDTTLAALLNALQVTNHQLLPYSSALIMELHQNVHHGFYVQLLFRNYSSQDPLDDFPPYPLTIPGCQEKCPYHKFIRLTKDAIPLNWDAECVARGTSSTPSTQRTVTQSRGNSLKRILRGVGVGVA